MKKVLILLLFFSITVFASEQLPVSAVHASETLPNQGKNNYNEKNLIDKNAGSIWAATFKGKPITIELEVKAFEINQLRILNGYRRDQKSYENNSRAKKISIYANSKDNLIKSVVLKDYKWENCLGAEFSKDCTFAGYECSEICTPIEYTENIVFKPALRNVKKIILEVETIYPGKKWKDLCISEISLEGYIKNPVPSNFKPTVGTFTDSRDGHKYKTIKINGVNWMAENLSYADKASYCYDQKQGTNSCGKKGRVYKASAAKDNICPQGWRLPTFEEFDAFSKYFKSFLPNEAELLELYDEELSSNGFGMNFYNLDKLCNCFDAGCDGGDDGEGDIAEMFNRIGIYSATIPAETAFWIHPMIHESDRYIDTIPFVRFNPREGSYSPVGELLGCYEVGEDEFHRKEFFVRCVKE